jgi:hypothetical protein
MIDIASRLHKAYTEPVIHQSRSRSGLYPSQASVTLDDGKHVGACHRQIYYEWNNYDHNVTQNPDWKLAAIMGEWYHLGVVQELRAHPLETELTVLAEEQPFFYKPLFLSGRIDILLRDEVSDTIFGVDIKSVGEWVCKKTIHQPKEDHILQCALYLWVYQQMAAADSAPVTHWTILYISRDENWDLKGNKHGSKMRQIWQFDIELQKDGDAGELYPVVTTPFGNKLHYKELSIDRMVVRYTDLKSQLVADTLPDRDYEAQYDETRIAGLYSSNKLEFKKDIYAVEKWMKKGAPPGDLNIKMGDSACMFCSFQDLCYSSDPLNRSKSVSPPHSIPKSNTVIKNQPPMF